MHKILYSLAALLLLGGAAMPSETFAKAKKEKTEKVHKKGKKVLKSKAVTAAEAKKIKTEDVLSVITRTESFIFLKNGDIIAPPAKVTHTMSEGLSSVEHKKHVIKVIKKLKGKKATMHKGKATMYAAAVPQGYGALNMPQGPQYQQKVQGQYAPPQPYGGGQQLAYPNDPRVERVQQADGSYMYRQGGGQFTAVPPAPARAPDEYGGFATAEQVHQATQPLHQAVGVVAGEAGETVNDVLGNQQVKTAFGTALGDYVGPAVQELGPSLGQTLAPIVSSLGPLIGGAVGGIIGGVI